jgi:formylglycine-generating enzyme required for sulfatase activity
MKLSTKLVSIISKNRQLFLGLGLGVLVMLPTGVYLNERNNSSQTEVPSTTQESSATNDFSQAQNLEPISPNSEEATMDQKDNKSSGSNSGAVEASRQESEVYSQKAAEYGAQAAEINRCLKVSSAEWTTYKAASDSATSKRRLVEDFVMGNNQITNAEYDEFMIAAYSEFNSTMQKATSTYLNNMNNQNCTPQNITFTPMVWEF